jgi:hypothetical protein
MKLFIIKFGVDKIKIDWKFGIVALSLLIIPGCKSYYIASDFNVKTAGHKTVAILPFEMVFTGKKPEKLSNEEMQTIGEAESKAFMISFYNEILRSTRSGKNSITVNVQHFDKTLNILKSNNIDIRSSWNEDPGKLAALLGVDAVVKARIEKHRLISDLASYGIDLGVHILGVLSDYTIWFWLPPELAKSNEVKSYYSLVAKEGFTLWSIGYNKDANWRDSANEIIDGINRKSAKRFPYRRK